MRTLIIHNPASGFGSDAIYEFQRALLCEGDECVIRVIRVDQPSAPLVADAEIFDLVVISGGDGTVTSVLYDLRNRDVLTCVFPSGTANLFVANLGNALEPAAIARACRMGHSARTDLGEVMWLDQNGRRKRAGFGLMAGLGYDALIMQAAMSSKKRMGEAAYFAAAVTNPKPQVQRFTITVDGVTYERTGISCIVANTDMIQGDIEIVPDCVMNDGLIDIIMVETQDAVQLLKPVFFGLVDRNGKKIGRPRLETFRGREVRVEVTGELAMQVDGDVVSPGINAFIARVLPSANKLVVDSLSRYHSSDEGSLFGGTDQPLFPK